MNLKKLLWSLLAITVLWSCGKDDDTPPPPPPPTNTAPVIAAQNFTVSENISDTAAIGTVKATDKDGDDLTFSIQTNSDNLFEITGAGVLSLASGKKLSFATKAAHSLTVQVSDGTDTASAAVTVNVTEATGEEPVNEAPTAEDQNLEVAEDAAAGDVIGTAMATDADEDELTYALLTDESELFQVAENGEISLAEGTSLDFETVAEYTLTLTVSDGTNVPVEFMVTVTVTDVNEAPSAEDKSFEVAEDVAVGDVIGTVEANDGDGDELTFALVSDESELFQVAENGEISLAEGKNLDFETATEHSLTLSVSDGSNEPVEFTVTITVTNVIESLFDDPASFILKFNVTAGQELTIGTNPNYEYDYTIDWGDESGEENLTAQNPSHVYTEEGTYLVAITGVFPAIKMWTLNDGLDDSRNSLIDVTQWGTQQWQSMESSFAICKNLENFSATDKPDLSKVTSMARTFASASKFNGAIGHWNTSNITDMQYTFFNATVFNQDISGWDVTKVTSMAFMFNGATSFNQDIGGWVTSSLVNLTSTFKSAESFNQDLSEWDTSQVIIMLRTFEDALSFDQSLADWDLSVVNNMSFMLDNSGMTPENLNATLIGWNNFVEANNGPKNITLGLDNLSVCGQEVIDATQNLGANHQWTFSGTLSVEVNCP
ncbi:BspA family leucine-rich repeat surface protein [Flagellimonas sp.]|uniref:BspA family leucine-rich repeat surface protein n=1 Tax=Flagellimonas sp. TaxID=2058762 RepID=UPI003BA9A00A